MNVKEQVRIVELEKRVAFQEDELQKLKALQQAQQMQMYELEKAFERLRSRYNQAMEDLSTESIPNEKPPHY